MYKGSKPRRLSYVTYRYLYLYQIFILSLEPLTKNKKNSKFQLKLTFSFQALLQTTPESRIASRSESPDSDKMSNEEAEENIDDSSIKTDFLKSLDTGG